MATLLHRTKGEQFFDDDGNPLANGKLYYFEAATTSLQDTFSDSAGATPNSNPIDLTSAGRLPVSVYFGDSDSYSDYKELLTEGGDAGDDHTLEVTVSPWPVDNLPAATPAESAATFAPPLYAWEQVTNADSPVTLTAADAGKAYEADTTSGNIEFDLPSAASVGDGKGFLFKKTAAANSMIIDQSGSEEIDNSGTALTIASNNAGVGIFSNGAEWYRIDGVVGNEMLLSSFINGLTAATDVAVADEFMLQLASAGAFRKLTGANLPGRIVAIIRDEQTSGTAAQTLTDDSTTVRRLNTLAYNLNTLVSLASNRFTLPAGTWLIVWNAPVISAADGSHQSFLYNFTDSAEVERGFSGSVQSGTISQSSIGSSDGAAVVTIASSKAFEIRHTVAADSDMTAGGDADLGTEVYTQVMVFRA